jgi:catechol 2,3-dioxygenase
MEQTPTIGHVHLRVSDLQRSIAFYRDVLGLELQQMYGGAAAFLSWGGYHHHIGLNTWGVPPGTSADPRRPGLYHVAILYPTRKDLAEAVARVLTHGVPLTGASDHGVSEAIYLEDPDGNGIELYWDKPKEHWPYHDGRLAMVTEPLDLDDLLKLAAS